MAVIHKSSESNIVHLFPRLLSELLMKKAVNNTFIFMVVGKIFVVTQST